MNMQQAVNQRLSVELYLGRLWQKLIAGMFIAMLAVSSFTFATAHAVSEVSAYPAPTDATVTPYGSIGKWMLQFNGQVADYGGQQYQGKALLEAINVVIVDPKSKSALESVTKLNWNMIRAGFPARPGHSSGFKGLINGKIYNQQPSSLISAYSDDSFLTRNNHGRLFGPAPITGGGYVYSGSFSTEVPTISSGLLMHAYVSSNVARDTLVRRLVATGQMQLSNIALSNSYNTDDTTTGDHDGTVGVIVLK